MEKSTRFLLTGAALVIITLMGMVLFNQSATTSAIIAAIISLFVLYLTGQQKLIAIFAIPELRQKIFITLLFLTIYRIGYFVPLPFVDQKELNDSLSQQ